MVTRSYSFHGVPISLCGNQEAVALAEARFRSFPSAPGDVPPATFEFYCPRNGEGHAFERPVGELRPFYELPGGEANYYPVSERLYISYHNDGVRALCDLARRHLAVVPSTRRVQSLPGLPPVRHAAVDRAAEAAGFV